MYGERGGETGPVASNRFSFYVHCLRERRKRSAAALGTEKLKPHAVDLPAPWQPPGGCGCGALFDSLRVKGFKVSCDQLKPPVL